MPMSCFEASRRNWVDSGPPDMEIIQRLRAWWGDLSRVSWVDAVITMRERFRDDRLGLTASSLTFTTTIAMVPFFTVALAVFTAFPMFARFQDVLQKWLVQSLVPDDIARQVLGYLNQFAGKASKLGVVGLAALAGSALALIFTIDRTLNNIWRVRTPRPFSQRVLIYWAAMTLGPLLLGASLSLTSYAVAVSKDLVGGVSGIITLLLDVLMVAAGMAAMFRYVPNTHVRWGHAWCGGLLVAGAMEMAKKLLAIYLSKVPTYSLVYGAFATVPILLIWIYMAWVIVLLGAALTAYLPSLIAGTPRRRSGPGWQFQLAIEVLRQLDIARTRGDKGLSSELMCSLLRVDAIRLEPVLETLVKLDWIGALAEAGSGDAGGRYLLLVDPQKTPLAPLMRTLLVPHNASTENLWKNGLLPVANLNSVL